ncbi:MAG: DUF3253 domain-containing protein [Actinomycetota bacterium]|nr:DUF3253 domain-containing protein [Actinomycetota bacterium]
MRTPAERRPTRRARAAGWRAVRSWRGARAQHPRPVAPWHAAAHPERRGRRRAAGAGDRRAAGRPAGGATICPSEAARAVDPDGWRELMPAARAAVGRLAAAGRVQVTQRGEVVDVATARGPVQVRRRTS